MSEYLAEIDMDMDIVEYYGSMMDHSLTTRRDRADSHPIGAITGLQDALDSKMDDSQIDTAELTDSDEKIPSSALVQGIVNDLETAIGGKVDKVDGKGLSANDFTDTLKDKLDGIESGAEANVQADWSESDTQDDSYIRNKPALATVATSGAYADLSGLPTLGTASALDTGTSQGNIPILGANGKLADSVIPSLSIMEFKGTVSTKNDLTTLSTAQSGDYAIVNGTTKADNGMWILSGTYSTLSDWKQVVTSSDVISVNSKTGIVTLDKSDIGLGNVDNTADADKPVSTAVQTALNSKQNALTFDDAPTASSSNPVKSGGVYTALSAKADDNAVVKLNGAQVINDDKQFTGKVTVTTPAPSSALVRNITISADAPTTADGNNGDVWIQY